ncbi:MAG: exodeoxyribonuclease VII large subunit, partial [Planctomycetia bacterium]|nr:exodeoxyribonuclease VII large subunit [Planctomycetia bacterium]
MGRGGGSLEDLWAFNEEVVVRAIHGSRIPVISAVGHEIDVTLADLSADVRALTPSDAALRVAVDGDELAAALSQVGRQMAAAMRARCATARARLEAAAARRPLRRPFDTLHEFARGLDEIDSRMLRAVRHDWRRAEQLSNTLSARLDALSPLAVLERGYSVTMTIAEEGSAEDG